MLIHCQIQLIQNWIGEKYQKDKHNGPCEFFILIENKNQFGDFNKEDAEKFKKSPINSLANRGSVAEPFKKVSFE